MAKITLLLAVCSSNQASNVDVRYLYALAKLNLSETEVSKHNYAINKRYNF